MLPLRFTVTSTVTRTAIGGCGNSMATACANGDANAAALRLSEKRCISLLQNDVHTTFRQPPCHGNGWAGSLSPSVLSPAPDGRNPLDVPAQFRNCGS